MIKLNLKQLMDEKNLSTADLVRLTVKLDIKGEGIHRNTISKLLNGNSNGIQFDTLDLLCKALELDNTDDLVEFKSD